MFAWQRARAVARDPRMLLLGTVIQPRNRVLVLGVTAVIWGGAALLAATLLDRLDTRWVVVIGALVGLVPLPHAALGAALAYSFVMPDPRLMLTLALPLTAGALIRLAHARLALRLSPGAGERFVLRWGTVISPPSAADWFWLAAGAGTAVSPLVALGLTRDGPDFWLRTACAVLVAVQLGVVILRARSRHRWIRRTWRGSLVPATAVVALAASGPPGAWLAAVWTSGEYGTGLVGGAALSLLAVTAWLGRYSASKPLNLLTKCVRVLSGFGLVPFWTVVVFHPQHGPLVAAALLIATETLLVLFSPLLNKPHPAEALEEQLYAQIITWAPMTRRVLFGSWLHDGVLRRPCHPDFTPLCVYLGMAVLGARGHAAPGQAWVIDPDGRRPLTGLEALRWTEAAAQVIDLIDGEVVPRFPEEHLDDLRRRQDLARADMVATRAIVMAYAGKWNDALNDWRDAAQRYRVLDDTGGERLARTGAAWVLACRLGQPHAARRELARTAPSPAPDGVTRWAKVVAAAVALADGEAETAGERLGEARSLPTRLDLARAHPESVTGVAELAAATESEIGLRLQSGNAVDRLR